MILRIAALGALGFAGYRFYEKQQRDKAGPGIQQPMDTWDMIDAQGDYAEPSSDSTPKP